MVTPTEQVLNLKREFDMRVVMDIREGRRLLPEADRNCAIVHFLYNVWCTAALTRAAGWEPSRIDLIVP